MDIAVESINVLLLKFNLPQVSTGYYKSVFTFPVIKYYEKLGFDFKKLDFSTVAEEFYAEYLPRLKGCELYPETKGILTYFQKLGIQQIIVSAMEHSHLIQSVKNLNIFSYFDSVHGLKDKFAASKADLAKSVIDSYNLDVKNTLYVGDTIHDFEVSQVIQSSHVMVANGHNSLENLLAVTPNVVPTLSKVKDFVLRTFHEYSF